MMGNAQVEGVGDSILLRIEGYEFLMPRDFAFEIGMAIVKIVSSGGDVLDDAPRKEHDATCEACRDPHAAYCQNPRCHPDDEVRCDGSRKPT